VNYLVPVDAELESEAALRIEAVRLDLVQETMEHGPKTNSLTETLPGFTIFCELLAP
jgi:uncharacterized caspase-like protein